MFLGSMGTSNVNLANLAGSTPSGVAGPASVASARASVVASVPGINGLGTSHAATTTGLEALATAYTAGIHQFTTGGFPSIFTEHPTRAISSNPLQIRSKMYHYYLLLILSLPFFLFFGESCKKLAEKQRTTKSIQLI